MRVHELMALLSNCKAGDEVLMDVEADEGLLPISKVDTENEGQVRLLDRDPDDLPSR